MEIHVVRGRTMMMWMNATIIRDYAPIFEVLFLIEIALIIIFLTIVPFAIYAFLGAKPMHRNLRTGFSLYMLHGAVGITARIVLMYAQYNNDDVANEESTIVFVAKFFRVSMIFFFIGLPFSVAFERFFATVMWSWYESQSLSTLGLVFLCELSQDTFSCILTILLLTEILPFTYVILLAILFSTICIMACRIVYGINSRMLKIQQRRGAQINHYSVARTYQIKDNIKMFQVMIRVMFTSIFMEITILILPIIYILTPCTDEYMLLRMLSSTLMEMSLEIYGSVLTIAMLRKDCRFERSLRRLKFIDKIARMMKQKPVYPKVAHYAQESDIYFSQLTRDLGTPTSERGRRFP